MFPNHVRRNASDIRLFKAERNLANIIELSVDFLYWDCQDLTGAVAQATNDAHAGGILASTDYPESELLVDGDMEAATTVAWTAGSSAALTKETTNPHGGTRLLRITHNGGNNPFAYQPGTVVNGDRIQNLGWARSDGFAIPAATTFTGVVVWTGVNTHTNWQPINVENIAAGASFLYRALTTTLGQYTEFDDVSARKANPLNGDYTGVTLGESGNAQVPVMGEYDGAATYLDVTNDEFIAILDPTEFTLSIIVQKDTWDAAERYFFSHTVDADNWIRCGGTAVAGQLVWEVRAGGTTEQILLASGSPTDLFQMGIQVKSSVMSAIYRGEIIDTEAVAGTWAGDPATMIVGAKNDTPNNVHLGKLAYHAHSTDKTASQWLREAKAAGAI